MKPVIIASTILLLWFLAEVIALNFVSLSVEHSSLLAVGFRILLFFTIQNLYVGLFITVHDACHGSVAPNNIQINYLIGRIAAFCFAGFSFDKIREKHHLHHDRPGSAIDPDFHKMGRSRRHFFWWATRFFYNYISFRQLILLCCVGQILMHVFKFPKQNVLIFWGLPAILGSLQLFFFGTFLPHRTIPNQAFTDSHRARNNDWSFFFSWLTCFHFGTHHHQHHMSPKTPWFLLGKSHRKRETEHINIPIQKSPNKFFIF